jgi:ZIP family zinc transporter
VRMLIATAILGLVAGMGGTTLGGLLVVLLGQLSHRCLAPLLAFAGGVMLSLVVFDMAPGAVEASGPALALAALLLGGLTIWVSERILQAGERRQQRARDPLLSTGVAVGTAIGLHNFAEGLAIGASTVVMVQLGITVAILITIHNVPEGMAMSVPFRLKGTRSPAIVGFTALAGLPMGIGALLAAYLGGISRATLGVSLAFSSGAMVYVSIVELIPSSVRLSSAFGALVGFLGGVLLGLVVVWAI